MTGSESYALTRDLSKVCEYFYRKGVADAASFGDVAYIREMANRQDNNTTLRFLNDEDGRILPPKFYKDIICLACNKTGAMYLRNFLIGQLGMYKFKDNICTVCDAIYRNGLIDGLGYDKASALRFFDNVGQGNTHTRKKGINMTSIDWQTEIKYIANKIFYNQKAEDIKSSMDKIAVMIGEGHMYQKNRDQ